MDGERGEGAGASCARGAVAEAAVTCAEGPHSRANLGEQPPCAARARGEPGRGATGARIAPACAAPRADAPRASTRAGTGGRARSASRCRTSPRRAGALANGRSRRRRRCRRPHRRPPTRRTRAARGARARTRCTEVRSRVARDGASRAAPRGLAAGRGAHVRVWRAFGAPLSARGACRRWRRQARCARRGPGGGRGDRRRTTGARTFARPAATAT